MKTTQDRFDPERAGFEDQGNDIWEYESYEWGITFELTETMYEFELVNHLAPMLSFFPLNIPDHYSHDATLELLRAQGVTI